MKKATKRSSHPGDLTITRRVYKRKELQQKETIYLIVSYRRVHGIRDIESLFRTMRTINVIGIPSIADLSFHIGFGSSRLLTLFNNETNVVLEL